MSLPICLVTLHTHDIADWAVLVVQNKANYCHIHGYDFCCRTGSQDTTRPPAWSKILLIQKQLEASYPWVFWSDADSVITKLSAKLELLVDSAADLILTEDQNGINTGNVIWRRTSGVLALLKIVYATSDQIWGDYWEQGALKRRIDDGTAARLGVRVKIIPQRAMNSYPSDHPHFPLGWDRTKSIWQTGDFMLHLAGTTDAYRRIAVPIIIAASEGHGNEKDGRGQG